MTTDKGERNARLTVSCPQVGTGRCSFRLASHLVYPHRVTAETITTLVESEEVLIADPRGSLTPAQMVDRKLLALLGSCSRSLYAGGGARPVNGNSSYRLQRMKTPCGTFSYSP